MGPARESLVPQLVDFVRSKSCKIAPPNERFKGMHFAHSWAGGDRSSDGERG